MSAGLPVVLRIVDMPVILLGAGEAAEAKRRLIERAGGRIVDEPAEARIAIVALAGAAAERAAERLRARGILVNVVDRPELCDFTLPAIVDRDPLLVAVSTGGASAGLAAAVRQRIEALLPASAGGLARALESARAALRTRFPDPADRRRALGAALAPGGPLDPLADPDAGDLAAWLANAEAPGAELVTIRPRSPDPDALTLREARLLARAERVYHRADVPSALLDRARADAPRILADMPPREPGAGLSVDLEMAR